MIRRALTVLSLASIIALSSCSKDDDNNNNQQNNPTTSSSLSFKCQLDGVAFEMTETLLNDIYAETSIDSEINSSASPITTTSYYGSFMYNDATDESAGFSIGHITYTDSDPDFALFETLFTSGNRPYVTDLITNNGVSVNLYLNGVEWSTTLGSADQSGSTFAITGATEKENFFGVKYLEVEAFFSCTVYDGNGNSKQITNGTYRGNVQR